MGPLRCLGKLPDQDAPMSQRIWVIRILLHHLFALDRECFAIIRSAIGLPRCMRKLPFDIGYVVVQGIQHALRQRTESVPGVLPCVTKPFQSCPKIAPLLIGRCGSRWFGNTPLITVSNCTLLSK